ncbi:potassium channel family protein [Algoriphagus limi]|uniref:Potassium channel family protein n=1 Tax=Algoriphagus limi TaxID=2975273 RepID=A0ABT2G9A2_9BACT|nr:potassium channel family protein [Algoriphagus limi]MCS5491333.1 potassium channel family protein [Algoriphagus limi]
MKRLLLFFLIFYAQGVLAQEENEYKEYSYTEFFRLIDQEKDSVFRLSDALIKFNPDTDQRFKERVSFENDSLYNKSELIVVDKHVELNNVQFLARLYNGENVAYADGVIRFVQFQKKLILNDVISVLISNCIFSDGFELNTLNCEREGLNDETSSYIMIRYSSFNDGFRFFKNCYKSLDYKGYFLMEHNEFSSQSENSRFSLTLLNSKSAQIRNNNIFSKNTAQLHFSQISDAFNLENNLIDLNDPYLHLEKIDASLNLKSNTFSSTVKFEIDELTEKDEVEWEQFKGKLVHADSYAILVWNEMKKLHFNLLPEEREEFSNLYLDSVRYYNRSIYANEISIKGLFFKYFKNKYDTESANEVYLELKDFETKRLEVLHQQNPGFRSYFKWKVNQFLKLFSDYGTEPSKAIVFSLYVIIAFALIYLFFPNSWDSHGKNRIVDRYSFFFKYLQRNAGMHEVYLEEKKNELLGYDEFKSLITQSEKSVPRFFSATALPLYQWAISGTQLSAKILSKVDILKGTWEDLPAGQKAWKSFLLVGGFLIALVYDLLIKVLNALMLSINTFTTLGFGEIPIKGLPRYLAIIQGFIGWFMLTIFSVSLISQLLN